MYDSVPVYATAKYTFDTAAPVKPYVKGDLGYSLLCLGKELQPVELESSYFTILKSKSLPVFYEKKTQKQAEKSELCIALLLKMDIAKVIFIF